MIIVADHKDSSLYAALNQLVALITEMSSTFPVDDGSLFIILEKAAAFVYEETGDVELSTELIEKFIEFGYRTTKGLCANAYIFDAVSYYNAEYCFVFIESEQQMEHLLKNIETQVRVEFSKQTMQRLLMERINMQTAKEKVEEVVEVKPPVDETIKLKRYAVEVKEIHVGYVAVMAKDEEDAINQAKQHIAEDELITQYESTMDNMRAEEVK